MESRGTRDTGGSLLLEDGRVAVWWRGGRIVVKAFTGGGFTITLSGPTEIATVISGKQRDLVVVDRGRSRIVHYSLDGQILSQRQLTLGTSESLVDGAWLGSQLLLGITDSTHSAFRVVPLDDFGKVIFTGRFVPGQGGFAAFHLTLAGNRVLVTEAVAPFTVTQLLADESARAFASPSIEATNDAQGKQPTQGDWVSLPVVVLENGFLQELSLLSGDARKLVRYNLVGKVARVTELGVPLGILDSDPSRGLLLAARRVQGLELVVYRWSRGGGAR